MMLGEEASVNLLVRGHPAWHRIPLLILPMLMAGCISLIDLMGGTVKLPDPSPHVFGGTRSNLQIISGKGGSFWSQLYCCCVLDFPLSIVMDVALLPVTVTTHLVRYGFWPEQESGNWPEQDRRSRLYICPTCQKYSYVEGNGIKVCPSDQTPLQPAP